MRSCLLCLNIVDEGGEELSNRDPMVFVALYRVIRVKVFAKSFEIHRKLPCQILNDFVKLAHIDRVYLFGEGP